MDYVIISQISFFVNRARLDYFLPPWYTVSVREIIRNNEVYMPEIIEIKSFEDEALDPYARLTEHQLRSKQHPERGVFIAESETVIRLALDAGYEPLSFLMERDRIGGTAKDIVSRCDGVPIYTADGDVLEKLTGFALSRGVLSVMKRPHLPSVSEVCRGASRIAVLENVADSTNVGAMIRSAAALGIDAVLVTPSCSDPLLRRSVRVSMGTVFQIPWTYIGERAEDWPSKGMEILKLEGFVTAAMALRRDTVSIDEPALKKAEKLVLILGTEGHGLSDETIDRADYTVKIPMFHGVDSLNVAAAAAVAFWETGKSEFGIRN